MIDDREISVKVMQNVRSITGKSNSMPLIVNLVQVIFNFFAPVEVFVLDSFVFVFFVKFSELNHTVSFVAVLFVLVFVVRHEDAIYRQEAH